MRFSELCASWTAATVVGLSATWLIGPPVVHAAEPSATGNTEALTGAFSTDNDAASNPDPARRIRFSFKDASFQQVIEFFSRETGLPVIWEAEAPTGTLSYLSPESYDRQEALRVLNIILQSRGVMLRVSDDMLYLRKLEDMQRADVPTFVGRVPEDVTSDQIITVVRPLSNALAKPMAERLAHMVAQYGSVTAMEQQNSLVITETAAQVRRLMSIIEELDRADHESVVEIFAIRHARAADLMEPLKSLLSIRVEKFIIDQRGQQQRIEEDEMQGLNISHDVRTNSIIARGTQSRIDTLREAIALLDVPASAGGRTIRTIALGMLTPRDAVNRLNQIYNRLPQEERPTVLAQDEFGRVTIVGEDRAIAEGVALLREIDGGGDGEPIDSRQHMTVVMLEHAEPQPLISAMQTLLNNRQRATTRLVAGPDGRSVVISGQREDVAAVEQIVPALDRPAKVDRHVRLLRLTAPDPAQAVQRARELYEKQLDDAEAKTHAIVTDVDPDSRTVTVIGSQSALNRFAEALRLVEEKTVVERETRRFDLEHATPSRVLSPLRSLGQSLLRAEEREAYIAPDFVAVDELDALLITARPEQFGVLRSLIDTLDQRDPSDYQFRAHPLRGIDDVQTLLDRTERGFNLLTRGYPGDRKPELPTIEYDELTGTLIVSGDRESVRLYEQAMNEARQLLPPAREGRMIPLREADARDIIQPLKDLLEKTSPIATARTIPQPTIEVVERTNSLYVIAEPAQHQMIVQYVRELDSVDPTDLPPLRLIQVRAADANQLARMLRERYDSRAAEQRREQPVNVSSDDATNTLVVTAHEDVFNEIREFVDEVNRAGEREAERETMIFPLKLARATDVARALEKLYPEPPMPRDRLNRPLPHLQQPREVHVAADAATNTLIIEAPTERRASFEALVERLDHVELPPAAELRTYHIKRGDPNAIANTLRDLANQGVLSERGEDGQRVDVTIQVEPTSRTLIVAGDQRTFAKTEEMLRDLQAVPVERSLRVFEIVGADAEQIVERAKRLYAEQTAEIPEAGEVSVDVDRDSGTLMVVADDEAMFRFASILNELRETIGPPPDVRMIALEYADAAEVVEFLEGLSESELGLISRQRGPKPTFQAIERTNSVLIAAQPEQHQVLRSLIDSLDVVEDATMPPLRILQLRAADAENLARALQRQYDQRPSDERSAKRVSISADQNTNALIVAAHPDVLPEIQGIVDELNQADRRDYDGREIRIFRLRIARAEELARTIDEMFPEPPMPRDARGRPMPHLQEPREIVVRADRQTNSLIVDAPIHRLAGFEQIVEQLDQQEIRDETEVRTYTVRHAELENLQRTLTQLADAGTFTPGDHDRRVGITITTEPVSRKLIVAAPIDSFKRIEQVLDDLDSGRVGPATTLRMFRLKHARAENVAEMLREVLLTRMSEDVPDAGAEVRNLLNVSADRKTNTLILSAPEAIIPVAEELIRQLDDSTAALDDPVVRVMPLTFADARDVSAAVQQASREMISPATGEKMQVRITAAPGSNAILLVGLEADLDALNPVIEPLDERPTMDALDAKTFELAHADATTIAPIIQRLLTDQLQTDPRVIQERIRRTRGEIDFTPQIRVEADARTNSVIVSAPQRTVVLAETLVKQLDRPDGLDDRRYETFTPATANPRDLAEAAERILRSTRGPEVARRSTLELFDEPRSGAVIVIGSEDETAEAIALLKRLDEQTLSAPQMDFRIVTLDHSDANVVAQHVRPMLSDRQRWPESLQRHARAGLAISQPTVTPDVANHRLLISAPQELMPIAQQIIRELDQPRVGDESVDVRIFHLKQAKANDVAAAVRSAMDAKTQAAPGRGRVNVTAEPSSNSIIVTGRASQLEEVERIIEPLDQGVSVDQLQVRTVFLKHARAESIAPTVRELLAGEELPVWIRYDLVRLQRAIPDTGPDVRVAADTRLNAVIISAPQAVLNIAEQMVAQLDVDPAAIDGAKLRSVRVLTIENADARDLASNLEAIFTEPDQLDPPPTIRVDAASNSLLVRATEEQFATIEEVAKSIDRATIATSRQLQMIRIDPSKATADEVARTLQRLLDRSEGSSVEVITVEELRERQQREQTKPRESSSLSEEGHHITLALAGAIAQTFLGLIQVETPQQPEPSEPTIDADVTIAVDPATNSIIVIGSPRAVDRISRLAGEIQDQLPAEPERIRYIALPDNVNAGTIANLTNQTLSQMTPPGGRRGEFRQRVAVIADNEAGALIVAANDIDFRTVSELIVALTQAPTAEQVLVKMYQLHSITAERAASSVQNLIQHDVGPPRPPWARGRQAQRMRNLAITLLAEGEHIEAVFDPNLVRVSPDPQTNSILVIGSPTAISFIDQFIELIDQTPVETRTTLKLYPLKHAQANEMRNTLRTLFQSRFRAMQQRVGPGVPGVMMPEFAIDDRTNTLIVTASPEYLKEIDDLLMELDVPLGEDMHPLRTVELKVAQPSRASQILNQVVLGTDQRRRTTTTIVPDDNSGLLLVRASDEVNVEIDRVLKEIDRDAMQEFQVRTIVLERASAAAVAEAVQRFFDDRARMATTARGRREVGRRISIIGHEQSRTLLIAASDRDFDQIQQLVAQFDSPEATRALEFRVFQLRHARAGEISQTVSGLIDDLIWNDPGFWIWPPQARRQQDRGSIAVRADTRLNALIVTGEGDQFAMVESVIELLDQPPAEHAQTVVRIYPVRRARLDIVAAIISETYMPVRRWAWQPAERTDVRVRTDDRNNVLIVSASAREQEQIAQLIEEIDSEIAIAEHEMKVFRVEFADTNEVANSLRQFLRDRARATNAPEPSATIIASPSANSLIVSAEEDELMTIEDLLARLDQPDVSGDRIVEIIALQQGRAQDIARIVREQFPSRAGQGVRVTPDARTNSLILNAPRRQLAEARALIDQLDSPDASDETIIRTFTLESARAEEARQLLTQTLQLDQRGRTTGITIRLEDTDLPATEVNARIVADRRSNSLIVTATEDSFPIIEHLIKQIDDVPSASPVEYRLIRLSHAMADDVTFTLREMLRTIAPGETAPRIDYNRIENQLIIAATSDQYEQIERILREIDVPSERPRMTRFLPLEYAEAKQVRDALTVFYGAFAPEADTPGKRNVRIVADPATNSLVISAPEGEWEGIEALLAELDSEEYDSSLQLRVLPLVYADAPSVARAINDAFQGTIERGPRARADQAQPRRRDDERRDEAIPTVLVESQEWVRASAEPLTNSVIVSASRQNIRKIEQIVEQLDVADFAKLPAPRIIPVTSGNPEQLAQSLLRLYEQTTDRRQAGRQALRIVADVSSNTVIVRASDEEFQQIKALADALQQEAGEQGVSVRVLQLTTAPAARVRAALTDAFTAKARQTNQPLSIQVDPHGNALIIASTGSLFAEIRETAEHLDAMFPGAGGAGQGIFIIELENISPDAAKNVIETIGLHLPQPPDSALRIVTEPVRVSVLRGRNAVIVVASPADREMIVGLLKAIDAEPAMAESTVRIVRLRNARAAAIAQMLGQVLRPADQQAETPLARAVQEQVRRLRFRRDGANEQDLNLDLTKPIRIIPDAGANALVISSTPSNVAAIEELVKLFDKLPITDAVTVQMFPLQNIAADQFVRIARDLFQQGRTLGRVPGSDVTGVPAGMVGKALLDEIAITTDERTNTVIVAGKDESVALIEVLTKRLDSDIAVGWVEPRVLPLRFADAGELAATLQQIIVEGQTNLPQATPLQRQIGRLRIARQQPDGGRVLESDVFQPMSRLVIRPDSQLNALILVGSPINIELVTELVKLLDIEAASPSAAVRIYPVEHASADRLAQTITRLFDQQAQAKAIRPEDRVIIQADGRTNSLIVTTSTRSFTVLESLLETLDREIAPDLREIRRIELQHASATRMAELLQRMMDARLERLRRVQPETADLERATIIAEPRTNSLIIAAGKESFEVIRRLAADLDESTLAEAALVHVIAVPKGNIDRIAAAVNQIMQRRYADQPQEIRRSQTPLVLTDPATNSLLVAANPEDLQAIQNLVDRLAEAPISPAVGLHVVSVDPSASIEQLANRLQRLMRERAQTLGDARTPSDQVTIEPHLATNSLIIAATNENLEVIQGLIAMLVQAERDSPVGREVDLFLLTKSRASEMVSLLNELHVREANRQRGENVIRVTADERLNAVLVNAPAGDVEIIRNLIGRLDETRPARVVETKFISLQAASAIETVRLIENVLSGRGIGTTRATEQATILRYVRQLAKDRLGEVVDDLATEMEVGAAIRASITLTPDVRTNTVIVTAPSDSMRLIEQMIRDLDASNVGSQTIRIFKLENADAIAMAQILTDLFSLQRQGDLYVLRPREAGEEMPMLDLPPDAPAPPARPDAPGLSGIELTAVPDPRQLLAITVDSRTNSLLVSGTPTYLDLVEQVIIELDEQQATERETFVYPLRNAEAMDVARVVTDFIEREQQKLISTMGVDQIGSAARLLEREITIVGDEKSNRVLVSASPRYMNTVMNMIDQLDVDPPQVLIQVMLAEITLDDTFDWGVDFAFEGRIDGVGISGGYGLANAFISGMGVPNLAIASSDFQLLINAMKSQGRLQVLSNPSVMAANNEQARIQVGETIRLPTDVSTTDTGRTITSVEAEEIGVILQVRPSINPDGFVRMTINPEISNLSARTTRISEDFEAPIITKREANTTVTVQDGQTIVLGGLISDRFERRESKVPLLGDIPLIGALFRAEREQSAKTELVIVLTPHVIHSPAEVHRIREITEREVGRLTVPEDIRETMRQGVILPKREDEESEPEPRRRRTR